MDNIDNGNNIGIVQNNNINDLNIDGTYNGMNSMPNYVNSQVVNDNITTKKKKTVTVSKELKTVIIITVILFIFILLMPMLNDLINNIRFQ